MDYDEAPKTKSEWKKNLTQLNTDLDPVHEGDAVKKKKHRRAVSDHRFNKARIKELQNATNEEKINFIIKEKEGVIAEISSQKQLLTKELLELKQSREYEVVELAHKLRNKEIAIKELDQQRFEISLERDQLRKQNVVEISKLTNKLMIKQEQINMLRDETASVHKKMEKVNRATFQVDQLEKELEQQQREQKLQRQKVEKELERTKQKSAHELKELELQIQKKDDELHEKQLTYLEREQLLEEVQTLKQDKHKMRSRLKRKNSKLKRQKTLVRTKTKVTEDQLSRLRSQKSDLDTKLKDAEKEQKRLEIVLKIAEEKARFDREMRGSTAGDESDGERFTKRPADFNKQIMDIETKYLNKLKRRLEKLAEESDEAEESCSLSRTTPGSSTLSPHTKLYSPSLERKLTKTDQYALLRQKSDFEHIDELEEQVTEMQIEIENLKEHNEKLAKELKEEQEQRILLRAELKQRNSKFEKLQQTLQQIENSNGGKKKKVIERSDSQLTVGSGGCGCNTGCIIL